MAAPNGMAMLLKAMGLDPQLLLQKGAEFELAAKQMGADIQLKVATIDMRLAHIETMLSFLISSLSQAQSKVTPAGETTLTLEPITPKEIPNGRYS